MTEATTLTRPAHTPGPWFTRELDFIPLVIGGNPEFPIADASCGRNPRDEDRANARLIAAAPDLLAALTEYIAAADNSIAPENDDDIAAMLRFGEALNNARAAIARATGAAS